uniref:Uncharacterized protein n=1 Tax=Scophthalmus maximus TaxID=52904 RepID=A0A8D3DRP5_SCOMX
MVSIIALFSSDLTKSRGANQRNPLPHWSAGLQGIPQLRLRICPPPHSPVCPWAPLQSPSPPRILRPTWQSEVCSCHVPTACQQALSQYLTLVQVSLVWAVLIQAETLRREWRDTRRPAPPRRSESTRYTHLFHPEVERQLGYSGLMMTV